MADTLSQGSFAYLPPERPATLGEKIIRKIQEAADTATPHQVDFVGELVSRAIAAKDHPVVDIIVIEPSVAALLFLQHNTFNREWAPNWTEYLSTLMRSENEWKPNAQGYSLYGEDGCIGDGGHRLAAQAYAGITLSVPVYFGMSRDAVGTIDCGRKRSGADTARLAGVANAVAKERVLRSVWGYESKAHLVSDKPRNADNPQAMAKSIQAYDGLLTRALEIAQVASDDAVNPVINDQTTAALAALLLHHLWSDDTTVDYIDQLQKEEFESEKSPLYLAAQHIRTNKKPKDTVGPQSAIGAIVKAMLLMESGYTTTRLKEIANAAKNLPDPTHPATKMSTAAE